MMARGKGWRSQGIGIGQGHEAYDGELTAILYGLVVLHGRGQSGEDYSIFTDSVAAMRRIKGDAPGPGQEIAIRGANV